MPACVDDQIVDLRFLDLEAGLLGKQPLNGFSIKTAVRLNPWTSNRRPFAAIQDTELNASGISSSAHKAVKSVNFAYEMAPTQPANRRIT